MTEGTRDVFTPQCIVCDEVVDLEEYMARLDANQPLLERMQSWGVGGSMPLIICQKCKTEPGRTQRLMGEQDMSAKLDAAIERHAERLRGIEREKDA